MAAHGVSSGRPVLLPRSHAAELDPRARGRILTLHLNLFRTGTFMRYARLATCLLSVFCISTSAGAQAVGSPRGVPDSVVLSRKDDLCLGGCKPIPDVVLRRTQLPAGVLEMIATRARAAGFYSLPANILGKVDWCQVAMSDSRMSVLAIYHADGFWSVRGYHHCLGGINYTHGSPPPPEKQKLVALEALVDSVARASARQ